MSATKKHKEAPSDLEADNWAGVTEIRKVNWNEIEQTITMIEELLDEEGMEQVALTYIPMSKTQRKLLSKALNFLETYGGQAPTPKPKGEVDT